MRALDGSPCKSNRLIAGSTQLRVAGHTTAPESGYASPAAMHLTARTDPRRRKIFMKDAIDAAVHQAFTRIAVSVRR